MGLVLWCRHGDMECSSRYAKSTLLQIKLVVKCKFTCEAAVVLVPSSPSCDGRKSLRSMRFSHSLGPRRARKEFSTGSPRYVKTGAR